MSPYIHAGVLTIALPVPIIVANFEKFYMHQLQEAKGKDFHEILLSMINCGTILSEIGAQWIKGVSAFGLHGFTFFFLKRLKLCVVFCTPHCPFWIMRILIKCFHLVSNIKQPYSLVAIKALSSLDERNSIESILTLQQQNPLSMVLYHYKCIFQATEQAFFWQVFYTENSKKPNMKYNSLCQIQTFSFQSAVFVLHYNHVSNVSAFCDSMITRITKSSEWPSFRFCQWLVMHASMHVQMIQ